MSATVRCLARDGYQRLTLSGVAEEARVSRPSIYRRYASKAELAAAALVTLSEGPPVELEGPTRDVLRTLLSATTEALASPGAMTLLGSLLAQERRDPELLVAFRETVFEPRHAVVHALLHRAIADGSVRADIDAGAVIDLLFGALLARALSGERVTRAYLETVLDLVWAAIARPR